MTHFWNGLLMGIAVYWGIALIVRLVGAVMYDKYRKMTANTVVFSLSVIAAVGLWGIFKF